MQSLRHGSRNVSNLVAADYRQGPSADKWLEIKGVVEGMYVTNNHSLKEVKHILARDYNFRATERMFKTRLSQWGFSKNAKGDDYYALALLYQSRKDAGKSETEFFIRDRKKTVADLRAHIRSKDMTEEQFLQAAQGFTVPAYIRCITPDPTGTRTSPSSSSEDRETPSPLLSSNGFQLTPGSSDSGPYPSPGYYPPARRRTTQRYPESLAPAMTDSSERIPSPLLGPEEPGLGDGYLLISSPSKPPSEASSSSCDQIQRDVRTMALQVVKPVALMSRYGAEDIDSWVLVNSTEATDGAQDNGILCSKCHQPMSKHCITLEGLAPVTQQARSLLSSAAQDAMLLPSTTDGQGEAWRWMAYCFGACIYMSWGNKQLSDMHLKGAEAELEEMLSKNDCLTLMSLNQLLLILHTHDQGSIAEAIVRSALEVAERILSVNDGIRITIEWMVTVAGRTLQKSGHNEQVLFSLERVHQAFETNLGATSPTTIASLYNAAWMLCYEGRWAEAEEKLHDLYTRSSTSLGSMHLQSTMILTTLGRAQTRQGKHTAAISTIKQAICDSASTLGRRHPYRLELKRRLALMYQVSGEKELMVDLYWDVLKGRIKMLGAQHPYTAGAREDLEELLKELGRWIDDGSTQWSIDELFTRTSPTLSEHEAY